MGKLAAYTAGLLAFLLAMAVGGLLVFQQPRVTRSSDTGFRLYQPHPLTAALTTASAHSAVAEIARMSVAERIRSLLVVAKPGTDSSSLSGFTDSVGAGGFILMKQNVPSTAVELQQLTTVLAGAPAFPRLIAIDEEGGDVTRLPYDGFAGAKTLRNAPVSEATAAFSQRGSLLNTVGVTVNFGIVADVTPDPRSFIYSRSLGGDGTSAAERVSAAVQAEQSAGVMSTLKHFPGHGAAPGDSHTSIPATNMDYAGWLSVDGLPFIAGIKAGARAVMFGHLRYDAVDGQPASLSPSWHRILRDQLGFTGLAVTDDMLMLQRTKLPEFVDPNENAIRAIAAGNDVLVYVFSETPESNGVNVDQLVSSVVQAVQSGRISEQRINEAALRVMAARRTLSVDAKKDTQVCNIECTVGYSLLFPHSAHQ